MTEKQAWYQATTLRTGMAWSLSPLLGYQNYRLLHHLYPTIPFYCYWQPISKPQAAERASS